MPPAALLIVDLDRTSRSIDRGIYGQFLEHINHSNLSFQNGSKSVCLTVDGGHASIRQTRIFLDKGVVYDGFLWTRRDQSSPSLSLQVKTAEGYVRHSKHPAIEIAVLEWSLQHTYDWRAGLHAAGSLMMYEELSLELSMTCPALLMRNTTDDPTWTSAIYHDHVSWFPGGSYPVAKLFREHFAERFLGSAMGTFHSVPNEAALLDKVSNAIPQGWQPGSVDAIATGSEDGKRIVVKAVNYQGQLNNLLVRLQGAAAPSTAQVTLRTITADLLETASLENPGRFQVKTRSLPYSKTLSIALEPYTVAVIKIRGS